MAKQTSLFGKVSGKLGAVVFSSSGGETVTREYNPNVANPSTGAQVNQRARMKLMSQLAAVFAPVLALKRVGNKTPRNEWIKRNFGLSIATDGQAQISYENIQLTSGTTALPQIVYEQNAQTNAYALSLQDDSSLIVDRVVWVIYRKTADSTLQLVESHIVNDAGAGGKFALEITLNDNYIVYAYGMRDTNAKATAKYYNYSVTTANDLAQLIASRQIDAADYQLTKTRGTTIVSGEPVPPTPSNEVRLFVTATEGGTATGAGTFTIGDTVEVVATPNPPHGDYIYSFNGWYDNTTQQLLSTDSTYSFEIFEDTDLIASFNVQQEI
jgi:hypothetical protein